MQSPIIVVNTNSKRESGRKAQYSNILAAKTVADVIRSCLGPSSMLKMLMDPMGGIVLTNDGNAILREIEVSHPAAKSMIDLSRTQDDEVGDGTTSVIILAGEVLALCQTFLQKNIHPIIILSGLRRALADALLLLQEFSVPVDVADEAAMKRLIRASINTKFSGRWADLMCHLALTAVRTVAVTETESGTAVRTSTSSSSSLSSLSLSTSSASATGTAVALEVDIKRHVRVEKIPGGEIESSSVLDGIMLNKDVTHPKMRRHIENPRILLLDCPLEYKKGESQTNIELMQEGDWERVLQIEEEQIKELCDKIISFSPDIVFTEKGISDLAQHYFVKANITAIRRVRKMDNHRIARAVGANIVNRVEELKESDIGTGCGLFHIEKIADEYYTYLEKCKNPKACSVILRGASKDVLNELERDLQDALCVARNIYYFPRLVPGGGAIEMAIASRLTTKSRGLLAPSNEQQQQQQQSHGSSPVASTTPSLITGPYRAVAEALEVIPRTLISNCGGDVIRTLTQLRAKHAEGGANSFTWGVDGVTGKIVNMASHPSGQEAGIWEPLVVKIQTLQTAVESACMLLRVDDIVSGIAKKDKSGGSNQGGAPEGPSGGGDMEVPEREE